MKVDNDFYNLANMQKKKEKKKKKTWKDVLTLLKGRRRLQTIERLLRGKIRQLNVILLFFYLVSMNWVNECVPILVAWKF